MDAPLRVAEISPARNARLLLVSSHANPPSSQASFQNEVIHLTESTVCLLSSTLLPALSVSAVPKFHSSGYDQAGASPKVWPSVWPMGWPFFFSFMPRSRYSSIVLGGALAPTSANHDLRYAMSSPEMLHGSARNFLPSLTACSDCG